MPDGRPLYQAHKYQAALKLVKERKVFCDIGAHCALWSMQAAQDFEQIVAFEPHPAHRECYVANMQGHDYTLHGVGLGEDEGYADFEYDPHSTGGTHIRMGEDAKGCEVKRLDSFELERIDLMKIDVEGFELPVLIGAEETILRCRPVIVVEQKGREQIYYDDSRGGALQFLKDLGMREVSRQISGDHFLSF